MLRTNTLRGKRRSPQVLGTLQTYLRAPDPELKCPNEQHYGTSKLRPTYILQVIIISISALLSGCGCLTCVSTQDAGCSIVADRVEQLLLASELHYRRNGNELSVRPWDREQLNDLVFGEVFTPVGYANFLGDEESEKFLQFLRAKNIPYHLNCMGLAYPIGDGAGSAYLNDDFKGGEVRASFATEDKEDMALVAGVLEKRGVPFCVSETNENDLIFSWSAKPEGRDAEVIYEDVYYHRIGDRTLETQSQISPPTCTPNQFPNPIYADYLNEFTTN